MKVNFIILFLMVSYLFYIRVLWTTWDSILNLIQKK